MGLRADLGRLERAFRWPARAPRGHRFVDLEPGHFEPFLEIENVGTTPIAVVASHPFALTSELRDSAGNIVRPTSTRADVLSSPRWVALAPGARERVAISIASADGSSPAHLDLTTDVWRLSAGQFRLGTHWAASWPPSTRAPARAWAGAIDLSIGLTIR